MVVELAAELPAALGATPCAEAVESAVTTCVVLTLGVFPAEPDVLVEPAVGPPVLAEPDITGLGAPVVLPTDPFEDVLVPVVLAVVPAEPLVMAEPVEVVLVFTEGAAVSAVPDEPVVAGLDEPVALVVDPDEPVVPAFALTADPAVVPVEFVAPVLELPAAWEMALL
ncbi:hypothetical protein [Methylobacterium longum]|uniref:Tash protein pest motif family n=1 Tax=Methylobacterium longum TaxID=767694 RepID=A0ABT8AUB9_9HYPH|nr:hypothetical protein [Methylobacterium longum]MDN3573005.1 hypothetical protein [Methylobacterium longum]